MAQSVSSASHSIQGAPSTTQFLHSIQSNEAPIFGRRKINHLPPHPVTHVVASAKRVVLVLANKSVQRVDQSRQDGRVETIDLCKTVGDKNSASLTRHCKVINETKNNVKGVRIIGLLCILPTVFKV